MLGWHLLPIDPAPQFAVNIHRDEEIKCSDERCSYPPLRLGRTGKIGAVDPEFVKLIEGVTPADGPAPH